MVPEYISNTIYRNVLKPIFFSMDPEFIHNIMIKRGEFLGEYKITRDLTKLIFSYESDKLKKTIDGIEFKNPVGLSAGFNYDGDAAAILSSVGFGFHTVGTVTAKPYEGNTKPRLKRLIKSKSLLVNKGFKSKGAKQVANLLDKKYLDDTTLGLSVGSSNIPEVDTLQKAIEDVLFTFEVFKNKEYVKYFELNISCPNISLADNFIPPDNFRQLVEEVGKLNIKQPIYVKMPNELGINETNVLTDIALENNVVRGFIFSNLVKDRSNEKFVKEEIDSVKELKGNFSGKPTEKNSLVLLENARKRYGRDVTLIGVGGIFSPEDAIKKFDAGADLVQLITGMIFQGPQLIGQINKALDKR